jgi:hypothetical protein
MDITELKSAWDVLQQDVIKNDKVEDNKIATSIHSKSISEISKIKRGLHIKFVVASLSLVGALALAFISIMSPDANPIDFLFSPVVSATFFLVISFSVSVMVYFNYKAYSQIKAIQYSSLNLKENLAGFIDAMERAISFNIYSDAFMTPIIFTWAYYAYAFENHPLGFDVRTALLFIIPVFIGLLSYFIQRYMQRLKFGRYLSRLSGYLKSLQKNQAEL